MGIDIPNLDDRSFEEIFEQAKRQIPVHTDEWTDHNAHDSGIAILELFAWVSETYTYQIDQVSNADREKYLSLLGVSRRPPEPAKTQISVAVPDGAGGVKIPAGEQLEVDDRSETDKRFETDRETVLTEAELVSVVTHADDDTVNNTRENRMKNTRFYPFGDDPDTGDALYLGFDRYPFADADRLTLSFDFRDEDLPDTATHGTYESTFEPSVAVRWEYCTEHEVEDGGETWTEVPVIVDETNSFYQGGNVTLGKPLSWTPDHEDTNATQICDQQSELFWLRCTVETPGYEVVPRLNAVRLNVLYASHRQTIHDELLCHDDGTIETTIESNQEFVFEHSPVLSATITVDGKEWTEVDDFDSSGPTDKHYTLDKLSGTVTFGNGINGTKPAVGKQVVAASYVHGGGADGNVSERAEWEFADSQKEIGPEVSLSDLSLTPLCPASGGTEMESIGEAIDRYKQDLNTPYRAATLEDYKYVASHTPGLRFGRAEAVAETKQRRRHRTPHGIERQEIHVVIVPYSTQLKPTPSDAFLEAVEHHLQRHRLITDQVVVHEPKYVDIDVSLVVTVLSSQSDEDAIRQITTELTEYIHPITGYDGDGWPFGRTLYETELEDIVATLPIVKGVVDITLTANGEAEIDDYGNVIIEDTSLLSLSEKNVSVTIAEEKDGNGDVR